MKNWIIRFCLIASVIAVTGCRVTTDNTSDNHYVVLDMRHAHPPSSYASWLSTTYTTLHYYGFPLSYAEIEYQYEHYYGSPYPSIYDLSWLLWDLGGIESGIKGWLSLEELHLSINRGHPIWINYGSYVHGHLVMVYGYDSWGRVYVYEPGFGVRVIHYDSLSTRTVSGVVYYWEYSLLIEP